MLMTTAQLLARARAAANRQVIYRLGAGGMRPDAEGPWDAQQQCDCSGFVCWALGMSRQSNHPFYLKCNGGWVNTDAIVADANHSTGFFQRIEAPIPGALIVFPSAKPARGVGHVGIVSVLDENNQVSRVLHCSSGNYRNTGSAVRETPPNVFRVPDVIFAWYEGLT
jgi:hypothetical protein